jgi:hydroxyethylthiazole kinase-like sugar kinase family protein
MGWVFAAGCCFGAVVAAALLLESASEAREARDEARRQVVVWRSAAERTARDLRRCRREYTVMRDRLATAEKFLAALDPNDIGG